MSIWLVVLVLVPAGVVAVLRNEAKRRRARSATVELDVGPLGVRRVLADGREESVDWAELDVVEVVRASMGPHRDTGGVILLGAGPERGCLVPLDRAGDSGVVEHLAALPGFDVPALVAAMEARPPKRTEVWSAPGRPEPDGAPDR